MSEPEDRSGPPREDGRALKRDVLQDIDFEIVERRAHDSRSGWTPRALVLALAALLWLLVGVKDHWSVLISREGPALMAAILIAIDILKDIPRLVDTRQSPLNARPGIFHVDILLSGQRSSLLFTLAKSIALLIVLMFSRDVFPAASVWAGTLRYANEAVGALLVFVLSYFPYPAGQFDRYGILRANARFGFLVWSIISLFILGGYSNLVGILVQESAHAIQAMALTVAIIIVFEMLLKKLHRDPLLSVLSEIRSWLAFDLIDPKQAREHARIAVMGLTTSELAQQGIREVISCIESVRQGNAVFAQYLTATGQALDAEKSDPQGTLKVWGECLFAHGVWREQTQYFHERASRRERRLKREAQFLKPLAPDASSATNAVLPRLTLEVIAAWEEEAGLETRWKTLERRADDLGFKALMDAADKGLRKTKDSMQ